MKQTLIVLGIFGIFFGHTLAVWVSEVPAPRTSRKPRTTEAPLTETSKIVVLQHHGTLDGPSGRFQRTNFAAPPVDLSRPPIFLPESIPVFEDAEGNSQQQPSPAASQYYPQLLEFSRTGNLASPPADLSHLVFLPAATPIHETPDTVVRARLPLSQQRYLLSQG